MIEIHGVFLRMKLESNPFIRGCNVDEILHLLNDFPRFW